jgi:hypothetical protein
LAGFLFYLPRCKARYKMWIKVLILFLSLSFYWTATVAGPPKLYLHLDNSYYMAGDYIWFKAYLLDGVTHKPESGSVNVYVELINSRGDLLKKQMLKSENGISWGDFKLSDSIPDGNYMLRAYTNPMREMGEDYLFHRQIYVSNPHFKNYIRTREVWANRLFNRQLDRKSRRIDFAFFPEGGQLIRGLPARLAFEARDELGRSLGSEGVIINSRGEPVARFESSVAGRGYIMFNPLDTVGYTASVSIEGTRRMQSFNLPPVFKEGISLRVDPSDEGYRVQLATNSRRITEAGPVYYLMAHSRGEILFRETVGFGNGRAESFIPADLLYQGVSEVFVMSPDSMLMARRLVFVPEEDRLGAEITSVRWDEGQCHVEIAIDDSQSFPFRGSYSLSVRALGKEALQHLDPGAESRSFVLLESDLGRTIDEIPNLNGPGTTGGGDVVDLLMLTSRWDRMSLQEIVSGEQIGVNFDKTYGMTISGHLIHPANDKPVANHRVSLIIRNGFVDNLSAVTNREGEFEFTDLLYNGMVTIELSSEELTEGYFPRIYLDVGQLQEPVFRMDFTTLPQEVTRKGLIWKRVRRQQESPYRIPEFYSPSKSYYGQPSQTIYVSERVEDYKTVLDVLLQRATGLTYHQGRLIFRGVSSVVFSNEPLFILDGNAADRGTFLTTSARDVHRIEIFRGANAVIFGMRGTNGAIVAYTRRGGMYGRPGYEFTMGGFYIPREFSTEKAGNIYWARENEHYNPTLFWEPDIRPDSRSNKRFSFTPVDGIDHYKITLEGVGAGGQITSRTIILQRN